MASRRPADWRFPTPKQAHAEATLRRMQQNSPPDGIALPITEQHQRFSDGVHTTYPIGPADEMPDAYWDAILADPRAAARPGVHISQRRLSEIPRPLLRVSCRKCDRTIEIATADAQRLYGTHAVWKDVGRRLLDDSCQMRTGSHEDDGCWPSYETESR